VVAAGLRTDYGRVPAARQQVGVEGRFSMRFDRRFLIVLSASLLWALVVSAMFYRLASGSGGRRRAEPQKQVVVAVKPLPVGATISRDEVRLRDVPENLLPAGAFSLLEEVIDRPVISPIQPDEPVLEARLAAKGSGMGLAPLIPPGMRALAVRVNDVAGVAGFILPGMRVDVLVTGHGAMQAETVTRTVLQNIAVLSAGQTTQIDGKSQSIQVPVVTLLVTPHDAEALTLANSDGHVQLVLRNSADPQPVATPGSRQRDLYGSVAPIERAAEPAPEPPPEKPHPVAAQASRPPAPAPSTTKVNVAPRPATDEMEVIQGKNRTIEVLARKAPAK
jgi:pilus assembly protein CpaB